MSVEKINLYRNGEDDGTHPRSGYLALLPKGKAYFGGSTYYRDGYTPSATPVAAAEPRYVLATYADGGSNRCVGILDTVTNKVAGFLAADTPEERAGLQRKIDEGKAPDFAYSAHKRDVLRVIDEPIPARRTASPKFPVGTRVTIVDDGVLGHRNGWTGRTGTVVEPNDATHLVYDIRVEVDGTGPTQFYNSEVVEAPTHKYVEGLYRREDNAAKGYWLSVWITPESTPHRYTIRYLTGPSAGFANEGMNEVVVGFYTPVTTA